jgi:hypothetical protein
MPGPADFIQRTVHMLEAGQLAAWLRRALLLGIIGAVAMVYLYHFRGLATSDAMDQAQIGRELARGHGWRTQFVRPRAIALLQANGRDVPKRIWTDTYNAPLPPVVDALALLFVKSHWQLTPRDLVSIADEAIVVASLILFLGSVVVLFFLARRLFDQRLAVMACGLVLVCDMMWQYSLSGLPQMLLLFLFNLTLYFLVRAVDASYAGGSVLPWLGAVGLGFGLLALTHALTIWIFVAAVIFCLVFFRPRGLAGLVVLAGLFILYGPWLVRNQIVTGDPGGIAIYSVFDGTGGHDLAGWMRHNDLALENAGPGAFRDKIAANILGQTGRIYEYLGWSIAALTFFVALTHTFRRPETALLRWMILTMWAGAVAGMAVFGINEEQGVAANQLHLLFVPIMTCYGLAFLLVQWNRLGVNIHFARAGFITLLVALCAMPMTINMLTLLLGARKPVVHWPPYVPPYVAVLHSWMKPNEITASDMPWAVSWYADRPSIWIPDKVKTMTDLSDYKVLGMPINGLYLTPISGAQNKLHDIVKGDYHDWAGVIERTIAVERFPLKWARLLGLEGECVFLSDHDREHEIAP